MKAIPMIFNSDMVAALLESRKTQTRRPVKPVPEMVTEKSIKPWEGNAADLHRLLHNNKRSPISVGDMIWVRETFNVLAPGNHEVVTPLVPGCNQDFRYKCTDLMPNENKDVRGYPWRPSIHMPRWASRISLRVTNVRVERLHDISEDDAIAEGVDGPLCQRFTTTAPSCTTLLPAAVHAYKGLWESIYNNWNDNPWVWVYEFEVIRRNVDKISSSKVAA